jgi:hypothetical protein
MLADLVLTASGAAVAAIYGSASGATRVWIATAPLDKIAAVARTEPSLTIPYSVIGGYGFEARQASDQMFVGHAVPAVVVAPLPGGPVSVFSPGSGMAWRTPRVWGSTAFATAAWTSPAPQAWVRLETGAMKALVRTPGRSIDHLETDGTWLVWIEGVGVGDGGKGFEHVELWKAPYSTDEATVTATKTKVIELPLAGVGRETMLGDGIYALQPALEMYYLIEVETGKLHVLHAPAGEIFPSVDYVGKDEVWAPVMDAISHNLKTVKRFAGSGWDPPM